MSPAQKNGCYALAQNFLLFIAVSFLGWLLETIGCSLDEGKFCDRGFLFMPLCTIYGFTVLGVYGLIGTPDGGGILLGSVQRKKMRLFLYFLLSAVIPTFVELLVGWFFVSVWGIWLWDYSAYRFNYRGYICLEFSILWGLLILLGMKTVFSPMKRAVERIPEKWLFGISAIMMALLAADWIVNYMILLCTK